MILAPPGHNTKLGPNVVSWSRPVGLTCPQDCPFLTGVLPGGERLPAAGLCYADHLEKTVQAVHNAWCRNAPGTDWRLWSVQLGEELSKAAEAGNAVRIHVGGDFMAGPSLDWDYFYAVLDAFHAANPRPLAWVYTHCWPLLRFTLREALEKAGIQVFASVHGTREIAEASDKGYRLAIDGGYMPDGGGPAWVGPGSLACPAQRLGHEKITCSTCRFCFAPGRRGNVVFYRHWPGAPNYRPGGKHHED